MKKISFRLSVFSLLVICQLSHFHNHDCQAQLLPAFNWISSFFSGQQFSSSRRESLPDFVVIRQIDSDVEERVYQPSKWICTEAYGKSFQYFGKLANITQLLSEYMLGKNSEGLKFAMTTPVTSTLVDHRNGDLNYYQTCLYLPRVLQQQQQDDISPPAPTNPKLTIVNRPELRVFSKQFGGSHSSTELKSQFNTLAAKLKKARLSFVEQELGTRALHYLTSYETVPKFWAKKNEVWLIATPAAASTDRLS